MKEPPDESLEEELRKLFFLFAKALNLDKFVEWISRKLK